MVNQSSTSLARQEQQEEMRCANPSDPHCACPACQWAVAHEEVWVINYPQQVSRAR
jgi:hypothetical protein